MTGWHWTLGLAGLALVGAALAPALEARPAPTPAVITPVDLPSDPLPTPGGDGGLVTLSVAADHGALLAATEQERFVTVTLSPRDVPGVVSRRPVALTLVVDTSGSMGEAGKISAARRAAAHLASALGPADRLGLVAFESRARTVLPLAPVLDPASVRGALEALLPAGGTNLGAGLEVAIGGARADAASGEAVHRVVVLSDGLVNGGITDPGSLARVASEAQAAGIGVSTVGLGLDFDEDLLGRLSDAGGGTYTFVDDGQDLTEAFAAELDRTASVVARRATVDLTFGDGVEPLELVGWEGARIAGGWRVALGDLHGGAPRQVVARVRVRAGAVGAEVELARVRLDYDDLEGVRHTASGAARATVTASQEAVTASVDKAAAKSALRAWGNGFFDRSARSYARGDVVQAKAEIERAAEITASLGALGYVAEAEADAASFRRQEAIYESAPASSAEGQRAIKGAKEQARALAR